MAEASVIGLGTTVRGNVRGDGSIEILGHVEGDVAVSGDVVLGEAASVRGNVSGAQLTIGGRVLGDLTGSEAVLLEATARVVGDLSAPTIGIGSGALVRGNIRAEGGTAAAQPRRSAYSQRAPQQRREGRGYERAAEARAPARAAAPTRSAEPKRAEPATEAPAKRAENASKRTESASNNGAPERRQPPPPVVPVLPKGAQARKKKAVRRA